MKLEFNKKLMYGSLVVYLILFIWVVIFKWTNYEAAEHSIITFRPLDLSARYDAVIKWVFTCDPIDIVLNMILFLPLGLFYVLLLKRRRYLIVLIGLLLTISVEISQFFTCIGMFNVFDIISNFLGCLLGYGLFVLLNRFVSKRLIDITNIVIIGLMSPVCVYAIIMTIINFGSYL